MKQKTLSVKTLVLAVAAAVVGVAGGVALGIAGIGVAMPAYGAADVRSADSAGEQVYQVNEAGQTYGQAPTVDGAEMPDLLSAWGNDGTLGYVLFSDLGMEPARSIDEIEEANRRSEEKYTVPLYESDGKTIIGEFTVNEGASTTIDQ